MRNVRRLEFGSMRPNRSRKRIALVAIVSLGVLSVAASAVSWHGFTLAEWWRESRSGVVRWKGDTNGKVVALTFDDGPDPRETPRVLEILRQANVKATFFLIGTHVAANPELAESELNAGHVVGNHTLTHPYLDRENGKQVALEIDGGERAIENALRVRTHLLRPPRGDWNPTIYRAARAKGDSVILWTVALEHHDAKTPSAMVARALRLMRSGAIVLMHDGAGRESTVEALPLLIDGLKARGYRFVTIPELLRVRGDEPLPPKSMAAHV